MFFTAEVRKVAAEANRERLEGQGTIQALQGQSAALADYNAHLKTELQQAGVEMADVKKALEEEQKEGARKAGRSRRGLKHSKARESGSKNA